MTRTAIGIDVGGTKIAGALVDLTDGAILVRRRVPTNGAEGGVAVARRIAALADDLLAAASAAPVGIGIGIPELVTTEGKAASSWNFDLPEDKLQQVGKELPVVLDSDVRCGARGEMLFGAGRNFNSFSYVSIGTGASSTQVIDRKIHTGENGFAIHFGSSDLVVCRRTEPEIRYTLEEHASGKAIAHILDRAQFDVDEALAGRLGTEARDYVNLAIRSMASYLGQMVNMLDPAAIIIGGGMGLAPGYLSTLRGQLPEFIWAESCRSLPVQAAGLGADSGAIGSAAIFAEHMPDPSQPG